MRRLILGKVPADFDYSLHVPVGAHCFLDNEKFLTESIIKDLAAFEMSRDIEAVRYNDYVSQKLFFYLFDHCVNFLNKSNGTCYSKKFWRPLVSPYLGLFVELVVELRVKVIHFHDATVPEQFYCKTKSFEGIEFHNTFDFIRNGLRSYCFHEYLYSCIISSLNLPRILISDVITETFCKQESISSHAGFKEKISALVKSLFSIRSVYGFGPFDALVAGWNLRSRRIGGDDVAGGLISHSTTSKFDFDAILPGFDWCGLVEICMPRCFLKIRKLMHPFFRFNRTLLVVNGASMYADELLKYQLAHFSESGGQILVSQHGSYYGQLVSHPTVAKVEYCYAGFITWGWVSYSSYSGNFVRLPSPYLRESRNRRSLSRSESVDSDFLLVGKKMAPHFARLGGHMTGSDLLIYRNDKILFLQSLKAELLVKFKYRAYPGTRGSFLDGSFVTDKVPNIKLFRGNLWEGVDQFSLIVCDHPGTTFLKCLALDIPCVGFWKSEHWLWSRESTMVFKELENAGIVFHSVFDAAQFLNTNAHKIMEWWRADEVRSARLLFVQTYGFSTNECRRTWSNMGCRK